MRALGRSWSTLHVAIVVSIALNLFCVAFIGEQAWRSHAEEHGAMQIGAGGGPLPLRTLLQQINGNLPPEDAALLRSEFAARIPDLITLRRNSVQAVERVRVDIAQQPFDPEKTRRDMLLSQEARQKTAAVIQAALLDVLPRMSDQGRRQLADYRILLPQN
jgi:Heavy-metal resistance